MILATVGAFALHNEFEHHFGWLKEIAEREDTICNEKSEKIFNYLPDIRPMIKKNIHRME